MTDMTDSLKFSEVEHDGTERKGEGGQTSDDVSVTNSVPAPKPTVSQPDIATMLFQSPILNIDLSEYQVPLPQPSVSSACGAEYKDLLTTIAELQTDLQRAASYASDLRDENSFLRREREEAAATLARTKKRHADARAVLLQRLQMTAEKERAMDEEAEQRREELDETRKNIESKEDEIRCSTLRMGSKKEIQREIKAELEAIHAVLVTEMKKEADKLRSDCLGARKELEMCRAELEELKESSKYAVEAAGRAHREEVSAMQQVITQFINASGETSSEEQHVKTNEVKRLEQCIDEMRGTEKELQRILEETREERDKKEVERHEAVKSLESEFADTLNRLTEAEVRSQTLQIKVNKLEDERAELSKRSRQSEIALADAENELRCLRKVLVEEQTKIAQVIASGKSELSKSETVRLEEVEELSRKNAELNNRLEKVDGTYKSLQADYLERVRSLSANEAVEREEVRRSKIELERIVQSLRRDLSRLKEERKQEANEHAAVVLKLKHACEVCRFDSNLAAREKDAMTKTVVSAQAAVEQLKRELAEAKRANIEIIKNADGIKRNRDILEDKNIDLEMHNQQLSSNLESKMEESIQLRNDSIKQQRKHTKEIEGLRKRLEEELREVRQNLESRSEKLEKELFKEQRKSKAYKKKALECYKRNVIARETIASLTMDTATGCST